MWNVDGGALAIVKANLSVGLYRHGDRGTACYRRASMGPRLAGSPRGLMKWVC